MMQAAPALSPPLPPSSALPGLLQSKRDDSTANTSVGRRTPSRETDGDVDRREMETGSRNSTTATAAAAESARRAPPDATEDSMPNSTNASGSAPTTALPGIRDLFPDELFEAQRLEPLVDPRKPKDPFFPGASSSAAQTNARNEREKDLNREAFAALTSPFTQARTLQRMEPRSPYTMQQSAFTFPRTTASTIRPSVPSASSVFGSSATTPTNALSRSNIPPPIVTSSPKLASSNSNRTQPTRPRSHAHTHSSDASAAAAGLLGLSISGGPPPNANPPPPSSSLPASSYRDQRERYPDPDADDVDDNDDDSMYVFEMDETKERSRGRTRERGKDGDGMDVDMECVETAPTSVDSHASMESKMNSPPKDAVSSEKREPKAEETKDIPVGSQTEGASTENDTGAERDVASSAENEGAEEGADAEGEGTDGKRHTCPHCRKRFNRPSSLKIHLNTHTGAKPFECPYPGCGRQFNVSSNMRRHYRNHSSPAGLGPGAGPGMGMGIPIGMGVGIGMHEPFGARPPPPGVLGLHMGSAGYPGPQHAHRQAQVQMERELERERIERERMALQGHPRDGYPVGPPSSYRPPPQAHPHAHPHANGVPLAPPPQGARAPGPPGMHHGGPYGGYPPGFGPREAELERRERIVRMERENWELRERERQRERIGRLERREQERFPPGYPPHPSQAYQGRAYGQYSPPLRERQLEYRMGGEPGRPGPPYGPPPPQGYHGSHPPPPHHGQSQHPPHVQSQQRVAGPGSAPGNAPGLRPAHSFSHPHTSSHAHPYARSSPSHSHSRSRERYSSGGGSPVMSPAMSTASSLPVRGWRGHAHTHSAPAFAGPSPQQVELPPLPPLPSSIRSPYDRDAPLPMGHGHGRSQSHSSSSSHPGPMVFGHARPVDPLREDERNERRYRRDSTIARTGHESELEGRVDSSASDFEAEEKRMSSDVDMGETTISRSLPPVSAMVREGAEGVGRPGVSAGMVRSPPIHSMSPSLPQRTPPMHAMELRRRTSHPQTVLASGSPSVRERGYSQSYYSHSRTGSSSSSGHGHGYASHPYARARHVHSRSREAAVIAAEMVSPRLTHSTSVSLSSSTSPRAGVPPPVSNASVASKASSASASASVSPRMSAVSSPRSVPLKSAAEAVVQNPIREGGELDSDTDERRKISPAVSRFPVYTFPPPAPPPGVALSAGSSPVGSASTPMEVEN